MRSVGMSIRRDVTFDQCRMVEWEIQLAGFFSRVLRMAAGMGCGRSEPNI
jgi:hypothetical protein